MGEVRGACDHYGCRKQLRIAAARQRAFEQRAKIIQTAGELDEASSRLLSMS